MKTALIIVLFAWLSLPLVLGEAKQVQVNGYYRKDGTYVAPYTRRAPQASNTHSRTRRLTSPRNTPDRLRQAKPSVPPTNAPPANLSFSTNVTRRYIPLPPEVDPETAATNKAIINATLISWLKDQAASGSPAAQRDLGLHYLNGDGLPRDEATGRSWLKKAAQQEDHQAYELWKNTDYAEEKRDTEGRIIHRTSARKQFMQKSGYSHGRPGYVIEHIKPIDQGGSDTPDNLQWVEFDAAITKETWK